MIVDRIVSFSSREDRRSLACPKCGSTVEVRVLSDGGLRKRLNALTGRIELDMLDLGDARDLLLPGTTIPDGRVVRREHDCTKPSAAGGGAPR